MVHIKDVLQQTLGRRVDVVNYRECMKPSLLRMIFPIPTKGENFHVGALHVDISKHRQHSLNVSL